MIYSLYRNRQIKGETVCACVCVCVCTHTLKYLTYEFIAKMAFQIRRTGTKITDYPFEKQEIGY